MMPASCSLLPALRTSRGFAPLTSRFSSCVETIENFDWVSLPNCASQTVKNASQCRHLAVAACPTVESRLAP